jgi:hypothetical protein
MNGAPILPLLHRMECSRWWCCCWRESSTAIICWNYKNFICENTHSSAALKIFEEFSEKHTQKRNFCKRSELSLSLSLSQMKNSNNCKLTSKLFTHEYQKLIFTWLLFALWEKNNHKNLHNFLRPWLWRKSE